MLSRLEKFSSKSICKVVLFLFFIVCVRLGWTFPGKERIPTTLTEPPFDFFTTTATSMIVQDDLYLWVAFGTMLKRIDLQTWALTTDQVPALTGDFSGNVTGLAIQGNFLYAAQDDGDLLKIQLDAITQNPTSLTIKTGASLGAMVADIEGGADDDKLYILDNTNKVLVSYDVGSNQTTNIALSDSVGQAVTPTSLTLVPFPTSASTATIDKIFVATNDGLVHIVNEGGTSVASLVTLSSTDKNLPAIRKASNGNFVFVLNSSDTTLHVIDTNTGLEVDTNSSSAGTNPISLTNNSSLTDLLVTGVINPTDTYAYFMGASGTSILDLNFGSTFDGSSLVDTLSTASVPKRLAATSSSDGYLVTSNTDGSLSVISDKPFVTIRSTSLTGSLGAGGSFTMTFQADETGSYRVRVGGNNSESGTQLTSGTVSTADTDTTTSSISYSSSNFTEGTNRVFVFVEDAAGNVGRDATDVTVDTPPPSLTVTSAVFGDESIYVTFNRLTVSDMDHYDVFVDTDATTVTTKSTKSGSISQPSSGDTVEIKISDLSNGTTYFLGLEGVDKTGNHGSRTTTLSDGSRLMAMPQATVSLSEASGEAGCNLIP